MKKMILFLLTFVLLHSANANNIQVSNVSVQSATSTIQFTVTWENGWRSSILNNWDAAWVFIKYYDPLTPGWTHLNLSLTGNTIPAGFTGAVAGGIGIFLYRSSVGSGTTTITDVQLAIPAQQASGIFDIKIFAIEMVYVPQGAFYVGDGISGTGRYAGNSAQLNSGFVGNSSGPLSVYDPLCTSCSGGMISMPATFADGFNAFYCMKYEITQGAYRDFLNSLTFAQQANHTAVSPASTGTCALGCTNRNYIEPAVAGVSPATPAVYGCDAYGNNIYDEANDGEWVPCNFLNWPDHAAYLDWAGLRPITELEYEKASRGIILPVSGEYAWGNSAIASVNNVLNNANEASETSLYPYASPIGNANYVLTKATPPFDGPFRNGLFATASSNRISSGGSFYGIMDMSGNLVERVITTAGNEINLFLAVVHGDGNLTTDGYAASTTAWGWPGSSLNGNIVDGNLPATGLIMRGGSWTSPATDLRISNRASALLITTTDVTRNAFSGARGGRTAP